MARKRNKLALYEVIHKGRLKSGGGKKITISRSQEPAQSPSSREPAAAVPEKLVEWPRRPRIVQFIAGRIEFSIPFSLAVAIILGLVLLFLVAFRIGQMYKILPASPGGNVREVARGPEGGIIRDSGNNKETPTGMNNVEPVEATGNHRIVIQTYQIRSHLEPVKTYFARSGIDTEIRKAGSWYFLVTKGKFENPDRLGTDGYEMRQKIIALGAKYKAPTGYEPFGAKSFETAYGKVFDD